MVETTVPKVHMGAITAGEARTLLADKPTVLLPMGSHEDQGPHAPMGDYLLAEAIAQRIALRASERGVPTLVAPVLPFGASDFFGAMPGGIAISATTLRAVLTDMFGCLLRHGITRLIVINGHGGNVGPIHDVTAEIHRTKGVTIPSLYLWRIGYGLLPGIVGAEQARATSSHGADPLTSIALHLFPERVRADLMPGPAEPRTSHGLDMTGWGTARFEGAEVGMPLDYDATSPTAVGPGDPRLCTAETGAALTEQLTELGARFVLHWSKQG